MYGFADRGGYISPFVVLLLVYKFFIPTFIMIEYFVEVPNTNIQEPVRTLDDAYPLCYDLAQQFGFAEVCWYALNGKRVTEGSYTDRD